MKLIESFVSRYNYKIINPSRHMLILSHLCSCHYRPVSRSRLPSRSQSRTASRPSSPSPQRSLSRAGVSPLDADDVTQRVREQALITRFSDLFSLDRLDALDTLKRYTDDHENSQRIVFTTLQVREINMCT